ncbi:OstA-like protein [Litoribaculum gwangyangense]|uniref:Organic solvent tolerance-like N-terminal domain-containing protein n=1 Tax=Litoribaculum gwangyangense TaxID=1130722 RepID=A0ABP9CUN4_9FLAO
MNKLQVLFTTFLIAVFSIVKIQAQEEKKIEIEYAGKLNVDEENYPGARVLTRDDSQQVQISHRGTNLWCDRALYYGKENFIEAYGNVILIQGDTINMTSKYVEYSGFTELAFASGDVILKDPNSTITSDTLFFDRLKQQAFYKSGGTVVKDSSGTITSRIGRYYMDLKKYQFVEDVVLVNDSTTINSNYFDFYSDSGHAYLFGPSTITNPESTTYCEKGFYDTENKVGYALKKARINYDNRIIEGDSLYFDNNISFASATNNIKVTDTLNKSIIKGHYAEVFKEKDSVFITKRALAITIQENDSIYMHADKIMVTGKPDNRIINAYYNAKIFKSDISGKADSIHSHQKTGVTKLINIPRFSPGDKFSVKRKPILWNFENQMTGDTIHLISNNETEKLDSLLVFNNAFIISQDTISKTGFNQIYGMRLVGLFNDENQLREVDITKNAQSIFYARNDKQELIGIDKAKSGSISMLFENGDIEEYTRFNQIDGNLYPESKYPENEKILKGFDWREEERPMSVEDLFKDDPPLELPTIKGLEDYVPQEAFFDDEMMERIQQAGNRHIKILTEPLFRKAISKEPKNYFQVIISLLVEKNDDFQLFYVDENANQFTEKESITKKVIGNKEFQKIDYELPSGMFVNNLRLDIGSNRSQSPIQINSITIRYQKNEIFIPKHLIPKYFIPNGYIKLNDEYNYITNTINNNNEISYDPFFTCSIEIIDFIKKLKNN